MEATVTATMQAESYKGYLVGDLRQVWDAVKDPNDWKAPIACECAGEMVMWVVTAIEYFTATTARVTVDTSTMRYYIYSVGYRQGPAGDN
jgi:hypothetical protein